MKSILLCLVPLELLLTASLALVAQHKEDTPALQPRHKAWNTQHWAHHGTAFLPTITTTITITTTVTLPGDVFTETVSAAVFPTNTGIAVTTPVAVTLAPPPTPNTIPPITLIDLNTFSSADVTSVESNVVTAAPTGDGAAAPTPNDIPPVQLITIA